MGGSKWRKDVQQQQSFSVRILGEKLQHIKKAITLNGVCIHQSICMHREHAEAGRAASHAGLGNNYSGAVRRALLMDHTRSMARRKTQELSSHRRQVPLRIHHTSPGKSRAASGVLFSLRMEWIILTDFPRGVACSVPGASGSTFAAAYYKIRIICP